MAQEKNFKVELTAKEVSNIKNSLRGWHDSLVKTYGLDKKPLTAKKKVYKKAVDEIKTLFKFFNGLK